MQYIAKDDHVFAMNGQNKASYTVKPDEPFTVEMFDCFSNTVHTEDDLISSIDFNKINPATGPIYVEGAEPGDVLKVTIHQIDLKEQGAVMSVPDLGVLGEQITKEKTAILKVNHNSFEYRGRTFPLLKMIGVIGTAPADDQSVETGTPDQHGGNLDCTLVQEGNHIYLPVNVPGALLAMGDMHAAMGDGEVGGSGLEVGGTAEISVEILKDSNLPTPFIETSDRFASIGVHEDMFTASKEATNKMAQFLVNYHDFTIEDAHMALSLLGNLIVCQAVNPKISMRMEIPKSLIH